MYTPGMEPRLAVCGHTTPSIEATLALACELDGHAAIDLSLTPTDLGAVVGHTHVLRALNMDADLEIRYHLPLGYREIGHADPAEAKRALAWMTEAVSQVALAGGTYLTIHAGLPGDATRGRISATSERLRNSSRTARTLASRVPREPALGPHDDLTSFRTRDRKRAAVSSTSATRPPVTRPHGVSVPEILRAWWAYRSQRARRTVVRWRTISLRSILALLPHRSTSR